MKILLTGATGYIGSTILKMLSEQPVQVVALCRDSGIVPPYKNTTTVACDLTKPDSLDKFLWDCDHVIHNAGYAKMYSSDPSKFYKLNVEGTRFLLERSIELEITKLIHVSTCGVTGYLSDLLVNELMPRMTPFTTDYDMSKSIGEHLVLQYALRGLPVNIVRLPRVYGPGNLTLGGSLTRFIKRSRDRGWNIIPGDGSSIGSYAFSEDVANGIFKALSYGKQGAIYNLGGANVSYNTLFDILSFVSGKQIKTFRIKGSLLNTAAYLIECQNKYLNTNYSLTRALASKLNSNNSIDSSAAKSELGYQITDLDTGFLKTLKWLDHEKY